MFKFEGIHPHIEVNRAKGKSYIGAVRYGHFYVVVNKIGSIDSWTDFPPWDAYGIEGWWLDELAEAVPVPYITDRLLDLCNVDTLPSPCGFVKGADSRRGDSDKVPKPG